MHQLRLPLLLLLAASLACQLLPAQTSTVNYGASAADFPNPERGFYRYSETSASNYDPLDVPTLSAYRNLNTPSGANYSIYSSLVFRYFILDNFKTSPISQAFLDLMAADFAAARTAGVKLVVRFAYTIEPVPGGCSAGWVCPPYGDASKAQVLAHIAQLEAVLTTNKDVIAIVQMGFIGIWGENYYTDFFGDASVNGQGYLSSQNWTDRKDVLSALLDAVPTDRMVQVRYPQMKQKFLYGNAAGTNAASSPPITPGQAHNGSDIARIGIHNDCLLASADDFGTYANYDNPPVSDTANLKPYLANDSKYLAAGGETCFEFNPWNNCAASGGGAYGDTEIRRMHYSYLNADYNHDVNNDWTGVCMDDIKKKLGYRFVLQNGTYSTQAQPGQTVSIAISLTNEGYAAPFNPRGVELILRNAVTNQKWYALLPDDPRFWLGNGAAHSINRTLCIPANMPTGTYDLLLNLPAPEASIYSRSEFAIRLANLLPGGADGWEASTGYNKLGHSIAINNSAANAACAGQTVFELASSFQNACTPGLMVSGTPVPGGAYRSLGDLTSGNATVAAGTAVLFQSDPGVELGGNFTVELGGDFEARIEACPVNFGRAEPAEKAFVPKNENQPKNGGKE